jgi:hypothetical protein
MAGNVELTFAARLAKSYYEEKSRISAEATNQARYDQARQDKLDQEAYQKEQDTAETKRAQGYLDIADRNTYLGEQNAVDERNQHRTENYQTATKMMEDSVLKKAKFIEERKQKRDLNKILGAFLSGADTVKKRPDSQLIPNLPGMPPSIPLPDGESMSKFKPKNININPSTGSVSFSLGEIGDEPGPYKKAMTVADLPAPASGYKWVSSVDSNGYLDWRQVKTSDGNSTDESIEPGTVLKKLPGWQYVVKNETATGKPQKTWVPERDRYSRITRTAEKTMLDNSFLQPFIGKTDKFQSREDSRFNNELKAANKIQAKLNGVKTKKGKVAALSLESIKNEVGLTDEMIKKYGWKDKDTITMADVKRFKATLKSRSYPQNTADEIDGIIGEILGNDKTASKDKIKDFLVSKGYSANVVSERMKAYK